MSEDDEFEYDRRKKFGKEYSYWSFEPKSRWEAIILGAAVIAMIVAAGIAYFSAF